MRRLASLSSYTCLLDITSTDAGISPVLSSFPAVLLSPLNKTRFFRQLTSLVPCRGSLIGFEMNTTLGSDPPSL